MDANLGEGLTSSQMAGLLTRSWRDLVGSNSKESKQSLQCRLHMELGKKTQRISRILLLKTMIIQLKESKSHNV